MMNADTVSVRSLSCHNGAVLSGEGPVQISLRAPQWSYAAEVLLPKVQNAELVVELEVETGVCGVGLVASDHKTFLVERIQGCGDACIRLQLLPDARSLIFRTAAPDAAPLSVIVRNLALQTMDNIGSYRGLVPFRDYEKEPELRDLIVFDDGLANSINSARLTHLAALDLPVAGKRVLDLGCGVGHFSQYYLGRGASYFGIDGRQVNITRMKELYPNLNGAVADVQTDALRAFGTFDIVHCYGLLYHLDSPIAAVRNMRSAGAKLIICETMVCDSIDPLLVLADENKSPNQALYGVGCRPSPTYVVMALSRVGFRHVYLADPPPSHPDFNFAWRNDRATRRGDANLRCVFVASDTELRKSGLRSLLHG